MFWVGSASFSMLMGSRSPAVLWTWVGLEQADRARRQHEEAVTSRLDDLARMVEDLQRGHRAQQVTAAVQGGIPMIGSANYCTQGGE